jgi:hypothetical protein
MTGADGGYVFPTLAPGDYRATASKFGYVSASADVTVTANATTTADLTLAPADLATLSGVVSTADGPVAGSAVTLGGTPLSATTGTDGRYQLTAPKGTYQLTASSPTRCNDAATRTVELTADTVADLALPERTDGYGYRCGPSTAAYPVLTSKLELTGDDITKHIDLPFPLPLYGTTYTAADVSTNGNIAFGAGATTGSNVALPDPDAPNGALYPLWDDLRVDADAAVYTGVIGTAPHRAFAVEWRNVQFFSETAARLSFVALIGEDGTVIYRYKDVAVGGIESGTSATIGLEDGTGTTAYQYSYNSPAITDGLAIAFRTTKSGIVRGRITDGNDGLGIGGATVTVTPGGATATTQPDGSYLAQAPAGALTVTASAVNYEAKTGPVILAAGGISAFDATLRTARVTATPPDLEVVLPAGQSRTRTITLANTGALTTPYTVTEADEDVPWLGVVGAAGTLASGAKATVTVAVSSAGLAPGTYQSAALRITSSSGRVPNLIVPVKIVVPGFQAAIDAGSQRAHTDALGDGWTPDQKYAAGSCGYLGTSSVVTTAKPIAGTDDQGRYADARQNMYEYRCDGVASGVYTVELNFAELTNTKPNKRVFDVLVEGVEVLPSLDMSLEAGNFTAVNRTYTVRVTDGQLNVRFVTHTGFGKPLVNALRVTHRPDR